MEKEGLPKQPELKPDPPNVETLGNEVMEITAVSDISEDLATHTQGQSRLVTTRLAIYNLINRRGATALKWIFGITVVMLLIKLMPRDKQTQIDHQLDNTAILMWNDEPSNNDCPCVVTRDQDYGLLKIDAIVINALRPYSMRGLDKIRVTPNFLMVYAAQNPLNFVQNPLREHSEFTFNYTMTYRFDSDMVLSEYYFSTLQNEYQKVGKFETPDRNFMQNDNKAATSIRMQINSKKRLAIYMADETTFNTNWQVKYLQDIRNHMDLEVTNNGDEPNKCSPYKFMIIFDPSFCPDFVHPQVYWALANFVVPVLFSGTNIIHSVPPDSFVNATNFLGPKELAQYLIKLDSQPHLYEQFFWWHSKYQLQHIRQPYCALCNVLKEPRRERQPEEFIKWWTNYHCNPSDRLNLWLWQ